ncbi:MAG: carboxypeptidase regulatory-like domain-containing protein, partial [Planctomycetes bacterium]|nr:carboxypeptidase regulatory-like domain-containing protein [Planctomycetota bacterium]
MSQRTQIAALAALLLLVLVSVAVLLGAGPLGLSGTGAAERGGSGPRSVALGADGAETADHACGPGTPWQAPGATGTDEHGEYVVGPDGRRIYRDEKGRPWIRGPGGARIYVDEQGRPLASRPGDYTGAGSSAAGSGTGSSEAAKRDDKPEPAAPGTVTGSVVDDQGQAFSGAVVELQSPKGVQRATAGDDGRYSLEGVPAEVPLAVTASSRGAVSRTLSARLAPGAKLALEPLVLARDGAVRGVVRAAESGAPVA